MKQKILSISPILLLAITVIIASCSKTGPTGPAGTTGATGAQGPAGGSGPAGPAGTANVIYSEWLSVAFLPDTIHNGATIDTLGFYTDITANKLDSTILANGEIKVYLNLGSTANAFVVPLPYIDVYSGVSITPTFSVQDIFLYSNADASTVIQGGVTYLQYRYILIPGGTTAMPVGVNGTKKSINWNDYNEVKAYLGLKD
jgi:hypothetical protein